MRAIFEIDFALPNLLSFNDSTFCNIDALTLSSYISRSHHIAHTIYTRPCFVYSKLMLMNMNYHRSVRRSVLKELDYFICYSDINITRSLAICTVEYIALHAT